MNLLPLGLVGLAALLAMRGARAERPAVVRGGRYVAIYALPPGFPTNEDTLLKVQGILQEGSSVELDGDKLVVTMTAVSSEQIGDIPTPLGTLKLVSLRRLSDVVGSLDYQAEVVKKPAYYVFSGWYDVDGRPKWSGWTKPMIHTFASANQYMIVTPWKWSRALRWDGAQWRKA